MSGALGWWRHALLAGAAAGLLASPWLPAPAGWVPCIALGAAALALTGRPLLASRGPPVASMAAWLAAALGLAALAGLGAGSLRLAAIERGALHAPAGAEVTATGHVSGFAQRGFGEVRIPLRTEAGRVLLVVPEPVPDVAVGAEVRARGEIAEPADGFERSRVERAGAVAELRATEVELTGGARGGLAGALDRVRGRAEDALGTGMSEEEAALARGFVLGQDDRIDAATREEFKRAGLSHLLAVSGQNVMLLAVLGGALFALFGAGLRMRLALTILLIAAYVPIAGAGPSIQRAGIMGAAAIAATMLGRPSERAYPLLLAGAVTLLIDPRFGSDVGWQLSFAAVAGIMIWARSLRDAVAAAMPARVPSRLASPLAEGAALTIAATVATAPLIAHAFGAISLAALPANVAVLPAIAPLMWIGMAMGVLAQLPPWMTALGPLEPMAWLGYLEARLVDYVAWVAGAFAGPSWAQVDLALPGVAAPVLATLAVASALSLALGAVRRRAGLRAPSAAALGIALIALAWLLPTALHIAPAAGGPPPGALRITELDVGQGDAILLQTARGAPILVDGGPPGTEAADALAGLGITRLRAVVVTHDDLDHTGGLASVLTRLRVGALVHARPAPELQAIARGAAIPIERVAEGSGLRFGRLELEVLWPPREALSGPPGDRNEDAVVIVARFGPWGALLSADAEQEVTHLDPGPVDVLKVAHHGSEDAGLEALLERSVPRVALIGVGAGNPYGHPTEATTATLAEHGVCVLRTDVDGAASVELGPAGLRAWTEDGEPPLGRAGCDAPGG